MQERLERCYAAKTYGELDELIADLPRQQPTRTAAHPWSWGAVVVVALLIAAIVLSRGHLLWLVIPLFFFVTRPLLWRSAGYRLGWGFFGCGAHDGPPHGSNA